MGNSWQDFLEDIEEEDVEGIVKDSLSMIADEEELMMELLHYGMGSMGDLHVEWLTSETPPIEGDEIYTCCKDVGVVFHIEHKLHTPDVNKLDRMMELAKKYDTLAATLCPITLNNELRDGTVISLEDFPPFTKGLSMWTFGEDYIGAQSCLVTKMTYRQLHTMLLLMEHLWRTWKKIAEE